MPNLLTIIGIIFILSILAVLIARIICHIKKKNNHKAVKVDIIVGKISPKE